MCVIIIPFMYCCDVRFINETFVVGKKYITLFRPYISQCLPK